MSNRQGTIRVKQDLIWRIDAEIGHIHASTGLEPTRSDVTRVLLIEALDARDGRRLVQTQREESLLSAFVESGLSPRDFLASRDQEGGHDDTHG